jgi:ferritin-like metal-binding protein YciE
MNGRSIRAEEASDDQSIEASMLNKGRCLGNLQRCFHVSHDRNPKVSEGARMSVESLQDLLIDELKDLYSAEKQIVRALPKIIKAVSAAEVQDGLSTHLEETKNQVTRLEQIVEILGKKLTGKTCGGMKGVLEEGPKVLEETEKGPVRDAALISACQGVEHYEIAGYGSAREFAKLLGLSDIAALLDETLAEEKNADKTLTSASKQANLEAKRAA